MDADSVAVGDVSVSVTRSYSGGSGSIRKRRQAPGMVDGSREDVHKVDNSKVDVV